MRTPLALGLATSLLLAWAPAVAQDDKAWPPPSDDSGQAPDDSAPEPAAPSDEPAATGDEPTDPVPPPPPAGTPPPASTQPAPEPEPLATLQPEAVDPRIAKRFFLDGFFLLGFGGAMNVTSSAELLGERSNSLDLTVGGGIRATWVIAKYFGVGPMLRVSRLSIRGELGSDHYFLDDAYQTAVDIDVNLMGRIPLGFMDIHILVPVGFTASILEFSEESNVGSGWNIGVLAGARFWIGTVFNVFVEAGFVYRQTQDQVFGTFGGLTRTDDIDSNWAQGLLQVGASAGF